MRSTALKPLIPPGLDASLVLVRHGESTWIVEGRFQGRGDPPLSPRGERQAALVAARLADPFALPPLPIPARVPAVIHHSPLARASATARAIAAAGPAGGHAALVPDEDLTEIAQGEWEGLPAEEVAARWEALLAGWRRDPTRHHAPGGESLADAGLRVRRAIERLLGALTGASPAASSPGLPRSTVLGYGARPLDHEWAVVVAHDGIFRLALLALLGLPLEHFWAVPFQLCAISVVELRDGRATLRAHNLAAHLAPLLAETAAEEEARRRRGAL